jgi:hypothetical protein
MADPDTAAATSADRRISAARSVRRLRQTARRTPAGGHPERRHAASGHPGRPGADCGSPPGPARAWADVGRTGAGLEPGRGCALTRPIHRSHRLPAGRHGPVGRLAVGEHAIGAQSPAACPLPCAGLRQCLRRDTGRPDTGHGSGSTSGRGSWGGVLAALPTCHSVSHQQVRSPTALVGDEQLDQLVAPPGGLQAGRGSRWPDHDRRLGGVSRVGHGRARRRRSGRLAARARRRHGEPEHHSDREGRCQGDRQPCPRRPPWRLNRGGWLGLPTGCRCHRCGCRIGPDRLEPARSALALERAGLPQSALVDLRCRQVLGFEACSR